MRRVRAQTLSIVAVLDLPSCAPTASPARPTPAPPVASAAAPPPAAQPPAASAPAAPPPPATVRFATLHSGGTAAMYVAVDRGFFQQEGVTLEFVPFSNPADMIPALATNQI